MATTRSHVVKSTSTRAVVVRTDAAEAIIAVMMGDCITPAEAKRQGYVAPESIGIQAPSLEALRKRLMRAVATGKLDQVRVRHPLRDGNSEWWYRAKKS